MDIAIGIAAVIIALVSVGVAFWQANISKEQLRLARDTEGRTERALEEIKRVTAETRQLSQDVKTNIDDRITKILDSKIAGETQSQASGAMFGEMFMKKLFDNMGNQNDGGTAPGA